MTDPTAREQRTREIAQSLSPNQRAIITGRDWDIASRRARTRARNDVRFLKLMYSEGHTLTPLGEEVAAAFADAQPPREAQPFGYWIEQKGAEPSLLRKPAYIPEPSDLRTVTPLYTVSAQPPREEVAVPVGMVPYGPDHPDYPNPPSDWNGKRVWLGQAEQEWAGSEDHLFSDLISWRHGKPGVIPVRAYTPTPPAGEVAVPVGMVLVPREPTPAMLAQIDLVKGFTDKALRARYAAMLAAYTPPAGDVVTPMQHGMKAKTEVDRIAILLFEAFAKAEPRQGITLYPTSYWATFADMARAVIADATPPAGEVAAPVQAEDAAEIIRIIGWINEAIARAKKHGGTEGIWLFGSHWQTIRAALASLPTTEATGAGEGLREALERIADSERTAGIYDTLGNASIARQALAGEKA